VNHEARPGRTDRDRDPADRGDRVGRGGLKLEAALERFGLSARIRGAHAVDVGASTGGFTQVLLRRGAARVLAVDAGHGQLHESLRADARVTSLESTDWKRLSLSETAAAGPFDFFTVDVSFVAARNMLRGLAFRLRPGAEGVVLIKPQFELPDHLVKGGDVRDAGLRRLAVSRFEAKAEALGFEVRDVLDSPVTGGEGTVELLAHVRFQGRSDALPSPPGVDQARRGQVGDEERQPGAPVVGRAAGVGVGAGGPRRPAGAGRRQRRRPAAEPPLAADVARKWFAVTAPGTEDLVASELAGIDGVEDARIVPGGVEWRGPLRGGLEANLALRVPTRILLRVGELRAREFGKLRLGLGRVPWEHFLAAGAPVVVSASASRSRLYHTGGIEEAVRAGIGDRLGRPAADPPPRPPRAEARNGDAELRGDGGGGGGPDHDEHDHDPDPDPGGPPPTQRIFIRGVDDVWTLSVDTSGERLHRRGWRTSGGEAPLRETLAAALLYFSGWQPGDALVDPMCGAGTLPIEAATRALDRLPGSGRGFAFERWPGLSDQARRAWDELRRAAGAAERSMLTAPIVASDRDPAAVSLAGLNAGRAGVGGLIQIVRRELAEAEPPAPGGVLVANPPYGGRLGHRALLPGLYRQIGHLLRTRFRAWRATIVVPDVRLASAFRVPVESTRTLSHGGLRVTLLRFAAVQPAPPARGSGDPRGAPPSTPAAEARPPRSRPG
jgi:putative N6-adenine-specific DNA methylase